MAKQKLTDPFIRNYPKPQKRIEIYDTLVNGLAIRISSTGHKSFVYRHRFGKTVKRYTIGRSPAVRLSRAREQAKELAWKISNGIDPVHEKKKRRKPSPTLTFSELSDRYIKRHFPTLRQSTSKEYKRIIHNELNPAFGEFPANEINRVKLSSISREFSTKKLEHKFGQKLADYIETRNAGIDLQRGERMVAKSLDLKFEIELKNAESITRHQVRRLDRELMAL